MTLSLGALPIAFPKICHVALRFSYWISNWAARSHNFAKENFSWGMSFRHPLEKLTISEQSLQSHLGLSTRVNHTVSCKHLYYNLEFILATHSNKYKWRMNNIMQKHTLKTTQSVRAICHIFKSKHKLYAVHQLYQPQK